MTAKGVDKSNALAGLCAELGIDRAEVMAFGDADNDLGMLEFAGYGTAMANAAEICKEKAKYVTLSNEEDSVAVLWKDMLWAKSPN